MITYLQDDLPTFRDASHLKTMLTDQRKANKLIFDENDIIDPKEKTV